MKPIGYLYLTAMVGALMFGEAFAQEPPGKAQENEETAGTEQRVGGCCEYTSYEASALVTRIEKTPASRYQAKVTGGAGFEGFEVWFRIEDLPKTARRKVPRLAEKEHLLTLRNSWYMGPEYLEKYGIKKDAIFPCRVRILTSGTCSPLVFEFPTINTTDYFESSENRKKEPQEEESSKNQNPPNPN